MAYALVVEPRLNLVLLPPFLGLFLGAALLACALVVLLAPLFQLGAGGFYVLVTLYQAIHRGRAQPPDFLGQLGAVHALDALAFGLRFALLLLGAVALGGLDVARQVEDAGGAGLLLAFQLAQRLGAGQPL